MQEPSGFPNARFHLQETEMQFATGPWMLEDAERFAYSADHVAELIHCLFASGSGFISRMERLPGDHRSPYVRTHHGDAVGEGATRRGWVCSLQTHRIITSTGSNEFPFPSAGPRKPCFQVIINSRNLPKVRIMSFPGMTPW